MTEPVRFRVVYPREERIRSAALRVVSAFPAPKHIKDTMENSLLVKLRNRQHLTTFEQIILIVQLSIPAILAQISLTIMQYIDASMVGRLGANASASIGLVLSTTWMLNGLITAISSGFTVQVARSVGAKDDVSARQVVKEGLLIGFVLALGLTCIGCAASCIMPAWLGGGQEILQDASNYLLIYALSIPAVQMNSMAGGMIQCSGNMKLPSMLNILMCCLDVIFNLLLIFPSRTIVFGPLSVVLPGAGLSVLGAALGTALSQFVIAGVMLYMLLVKSPSLHFRRREKLRFSRQHLTAALKVGLPTAVEQVITCSSYIIVTKIVAPLGTISIAANSFGITAEGLCFMPGFGIGFAATTLIGQSIGAKRNDLTRKLGWMTTFMGMIVMTLTGMMMFVFAPFMMKLLSHDPAVIALGTGILKIEAFAEPFYGASIVAASVLRSAGDAKVSSCLNLCSIWLIRLPLAAFLSQRYGLHGVWIGMCTELIVRGILFLTRLTSKNWIKKLYT